MDRVFSVEDIADQFWSSLPPPIPLPIRLGDGDETVSGSAGGPSGSSGKGTMSPKMMNRSSSEWAFQRFLREASAMNESQSTPPRSMPPLSSSSSSGAVVASSQDVVGIKQGTRDCKIDSRTDRNKNNGSNHNQSSSSSKDVEAGASSFGVGGGGGPPPNVPVDSGDYQAFLKSRLDLACAAFALSRVFIYFPFFFLLRIFFLFLFPFLPFSFQYLDEKLGANGIFSPMGIFREITCGKSNTVFLGIS